MSHMEQEWLQESFSLTETIGKRQKVCCITTQSALLWNTHRTGSLMIPSLCILLRDNFSWGKEKFLFPQLQFTIFLLSFLLRQREWKKLLFQSSNLFALTEIWVHWWKNSDFLCPHLAPRQAFESELSYLSGIQKGLRNYGVTWSDLISRGESDLHLLPYSATAEYIRQPISTISSKKVWQLQSDFPW